jgi:AraC-like DNA-binding protein
MLDKSGPDGAIGHASRLLKAARGRVRIEDPVGRSGFSACQFQRRFARQVGMTPKLFARTIRFDRALTARRDDPRSGMILSARHINRELVHNQAEISSRKDPTEPPAAWYS